MTNKRLRAVMVDRDGVIVRNRPDYVKEWSEVEILPGALEGLALLAQCGYRIFVVTNQSAVGRGLMSMTQLEGIHDRLGREVEAAGGHIDGFLVCPHVPEVGCSCRKPAPGLLYKARDDHGVDLESCYFIGDHQSDIATATAAGCPSILVLSGRTMPGSSHDHGGLVANDLHEAVQLIVGAAAAQTATGLP